MAPLDSGPFFTNNVANPVLFRLLRSPRGGRLGRRLALVEYVGRRTGSRHRLVTQYSLDGESVRIAVGRPEQKTWWRNFRQPQELQLRLAGVDHDAIAHVVVREDQVLVEATLESRAVVRSRTGGDQWPCPRARRR